MNKLQKIFLFSTALVLSACSVTTKQPQLNVPSELQHNGNSYHLAASQDLGDIARYVYISPKESLENWQSEIEVLFDRNPKHQSIQQRIALRQKVYTNTGIKHFKLDEQNKELLSSVIYEPSEKNPTWQVNVTRGMDIPHCGFVQYQFSQKVTPNKKPTSLRANKVVKHLQKYVVEKEIQTLQNTLWQWQCTKHY